MESHEAKRKQTDDQSGDDESRPKRQNIEIVEESPEAIKITGLPIECLESIFKRLNIMDLLNVGLSNTWLNKAANSIFKRKYGNECVGIGSFNLIRGDEMCFEIGCLQVNGLKVSLQILRCFGPSISKLEVCSHGATRNQQAYIGKYMQEYCAESLVEIQFSNGTIPINNQTKPFSKVEKVELMFSNLGANLSEFNRWFPSLRRLELCMIKDNGSIAMHFPHLEHLGFSIFGNIEGYLTKENIAGLLRQNPQLQSFRIFSQTRIILDHLVSMVSSNPLITNLSVESSGMRFKQLKATLDRFATAMPVLTELSFKTFKISADFVICLIHQFNSIKVFKFRIDDLQFDRLRARLNNVSLASVDNKDGTCTVTLEL